MAFSYYDSPTILYAFFYFQPNAFANVEDIIDMRIDAEMSMKPIEFKAFCYLVENPSITEKDLEELIGKDYKIILENVKLWIKEYLEC